MSKSITASDAKNNFGGLLEDVAALGRVEIVKHGRLVAVVLSPRALEEIANAFGARRDGNNWGEKHMIPPASARAARVVKAGVGFDDE
jgi:prevent-host-death family protein